MTNIDPFRMLGRFDYAVEFLMRKYNLTLNSDAPDWPTLLMALSKQVNEYDRIFCERMAYASAIFVDETQTSSLNQFEADNQRSMGIREAQFIFKKDPGSYADKILLERDNFDDIEKEAQRKKQEARRNSFIGIGIVAVIIIGIIIYNLPYFAEGRAFSNVEDIYDTGTKEMLDSAVSEYVEKYPEGKHFSDVVYMPVKFVRNSNDVIQVLDAVDNYLKVDPNGPYVKDCKEISDKIWDIEIQKYKSLAESSASKEGADFVLAMLQYMKKNNVRTVEVIGVPHLDLKEYDEYPSDLRKFVESLPSKPIPGIVPGKEPRLPEDLVTIKDKISIEDASDWVKYVISALQKGFNKVLTPDFIVFKDSDKEKDSDNKLPKVTVNYTVSTQESVKGFPDIWTYTQSNGNYVYSASLYLGIGMTFDAVFSLPGESIKYDVSGKGDAGTDELKDVDSSVVYSKMCEISTRQFAEKIANEFGLKPKDSKKSSFNPLLL